MESAKPCKPQTHQRLGDYDVGNLVCQRRDVTVSQALTAARTCVVKNLESERVDGLSTNSLTASNYAILIGAKGGYLYLWVVGTCG